MQFPHLIVTLLVIGLPAPALAQSQNLKALGKKLDAPTTKPADRGNDTKACPEYGAGFYRLAGSDTCVRIGGQIGVDVGTSTTRR